MAQQGQKLTWLIGAGYCLAWLALDWLSDIGLYRGLGVTPWSPTTGLSLAFAYAYGAGALPFLLAAEATGLLINNAARLSFVWGAVLTVATGAAWMAAGTALRRLQDFDPRLGSVNSLLLFIGVAVCQACALAAIHIGVLWFADLIDHAVVLSAAWRLVIGHLVGALVVAPLPIMMHAGWRLPAPRWFNVVQIVLLLATIWVVFNYRAALTYQLFYLLFLPVLWTALRDGIGGAALILNVAQIGIIFGAQMRVDQLPGTGSLQVLMTALALTGLVVGAVVTDRQAAGQRLRDQHAALGRVLRLRSAGETAAAISHQINQPLTAISTYASVAREALQNDDFELARSALDKLTAECDRAADVARSIRELVKQGSLSPTQVKLQDIVGRLKQAHAAECAALDVAVDVDIPGTLPPILADGVQLEQAIDNLLTNSIEAVRDGRRGSLIKISGRVKNGDLHVDIEDDGPGFAPGLDALATTPFMTTKPDGSGLGLAIARSVTEAHGGSLAIIHRNSGACVRLRLPTTGK